MNEDLKEFVDVVGTDPIRTPKEYVMFCDGTCIDDISIVIILKTALPHDAVYVYTRSVDPNFEIWESYKLFQSEVSQTKMYKLLKPWIKTLNS